MNNPPPKPDPHMFDHLLKPKTNNSSGTGMMAEVPEEIKKWNSAAFLLNVMWTPFNLGSRGYLGMLVMVPFVGILMMIVLGFKGNEWAWKYKKWDSVEDFLKTQRMWSRITRFLVWAAILVIGTFFYFQAKQFDQIMSLM